MIDRRAGTVLLPAMQTDEPVNEPEETAADLPPVEEAGAASTEDAIEKTTPEEALEVLEEEMEEKDPVMLLEDEVLKWKDTAARTAAELDNYRKRMARERKDDLRYARSGLLEELLPVFDNFAMGLQMAESEQDSMIYKGMAMVKGQLDDFLAAQGVKELKTEGVFDPKLHDAIAEEVSTEVEPGMILRVQRKGYELNERLLRPASVVVAKAPEAETEAEDEESQSEQS